jgi:hypothetical protein
MNKRTSISKAAQALGRRSAEARKRALGKKEFVDRMRELGKKGGRPRKDPPHNGDRRKSAKSMTLRSQIKEGIAASEGAL